MKKRLTTISDLAATMLVGNLKANDIFATIESETNSGLAAGFGFSGLAQVFVNEEDFEKASEILASLDEKNED